MEMSTQLVEIHPRELKFICEVKKQSSCAVHLLNATDQYVAFKVKTTSPKKYCVRPNVGIIKPKSTYDFTVTMQAQKSVPSDLQCKDKFLLQSTVVPYGTSEEEITSGMFAKESQKYIEETKLRVVLTSAPSSPVKPLTSVFSMQEPSNDILMPKEPYSPVLPPLNGVKKQEPHYEAPIPQHTVQNGAEDSLPPDSLLIKPVEGVKFVKNVEEPRSLKVMGIEKPIPAKDEKFYANEASEKPIPATNEKFYANEASEKPIPAKDEKSYVKFDRDDSLKQVKDLEEVKLKLMKEVEDLRSKIGAMDKKLVEAEYTIQKLKVENSNAIREKDTLKQDLAMSGQKSGMRKIQVGFPPLFVCMVALVSLIIGFKFRV